RSGGISALNSAIVRLSVRGPGLNSARSMARMDQGRVAFGEFPPRPAPPVLRHPTPASRPMAIPTTDADESTSKFAAALEAGPKAATAPARRRGIPRWLILSVAALALLALGVAGTVESNLLNSSPSTRPMMTERVRRADMVVSVTEDGNVESAHNVDIK